MTDLITTLFEVAAMLMAAAGMFILVAPHSLPGAFGATAVVLAAESALIVRVSRR